MGGLTTHGGNMIKLFAVFGVMGLSFLTILVVMIYGWGLTPSNWWIIGGGYVVSMILMAITQAIGSST